MPPEPRLQPWTQSGTVAQLWRYPVKSMQGEQVERLEVGAGRRVGRPHAGRGRPGGRQGALGQALRRPPEASARIEGDDVVVTLPDGTEHAAADPAVHAALSAWLGLDVRLEAPPADEVFPMEMYTGMSDEDTPLFDWPGPPGTWLDLADVHWLTTASLAAAAGLHPDGEWDVRRFRPTALFDVAGDSFAEDGWKEVEVGTVRSEVLMPTMRCTMPSRAQPGLELGQGDRHDAPRPATTTTWASTRRSSRPEPSLWEMPCGPAEPDGHGLTDGSTARKAWRTMSTDAPLRIAYLTYRGKPHVGGQGVYSRHLTKALVDLGHHVEVLGGQPYPILDERVPLVELPEPRHLQRPLPDAAARDLGAEELEGRPRGHGLHRRHLPRAPRLLHAGLGPPPPPPGRVRHRPGQPVPRLRPAPHRAPARHPRAGHDPPPDHDGPSPRDRRRRGLVQEAHAAPLVRLRRHADAGGPPPPADHHGVGELLQGHRRGPQGRPRPHGRGPGGRRHRAVQAAARGAARSRAASSPPPRPTSP